MVTNVKTKKIINGLFYKSLNKKRLYNRNSVCQRVHAFLKSPWPMLLQISLRNICILLACFTFLKAVSVEERNFSRKNSTLVYLYLKSSVHLFTTQFCLIYVTAPLFPGGFRKKTNSWCARIAVNLNVHIQKITLCSYGKTWVFRGGYRSNEYFQSKNENVLVVISTFNQKKNV